jgi:hypothetical protein
MSDGGVKKIAYSPVTESRPAKKIAGGIRGYKKIAGSPINKPLEPAETTNSVVSDYMGYGSYSGSDIKVVVHYPRNRFLEKRLSEEKNDALREINEITEDINSFSLIDTSRLEGRRQAAYRKLEEIDEEIDKFRNMPTSKVLAELQTVSYSIFREKSPVRTLGSVYPRAYVRGPRTIGGSMIFTVFHKHVLHEILSMNMGVYSTGTSDHDRYRYSTNLPDQLPPLDISILFANEYGAISHMGLWGVEFVQEGSTFSIEDIFTENTVQYVARDLDPMRVVNAREIDGKGVSKEWTKTASILLYEKQQLNSHLTRRNPFL